MAKVYIPLNESNKQSRDYAYPGDHAVKFIVSEKGVKEDEYGFQVSPMVKIQGTPYQFYDRFRIPQTEGQMDQLKHMTSERTGNQYVDPSYKKWCNLQSATSFQGGELEDVLDFFNSTEVIWPVNLELVISSKDVGVCWDDVVDFFTTHCMKGDKPKGWSQREYDGADIITWRLYKVDETNQELVDQVLAWGGVKTNNVLNGYNKPKLVK